MVNQKSHFEHLFITKKHARTFKHGIESSKANDIEINSKANIIYIDEDEEIYYNDTIKSSINSCDKFIISGLFDDLSYLLLYPQEIWDKTYLHFWGGDFYRFRNINHASNGLSHSFELLLEAVSRCKAILTVVDADYEELVSVTGIHKLHFEAPMPENDDFLKCCDVKCFDDNHSDKLLRIVVGNSASSDNCHIELFNMISWLSNYNVEIVCPLAYGEKSYRNTVISEGVRLFGNKISFMTEYMPLRDYISFLNSFDVGIYNTNRQQGLKNIMIMISLGKKVYLRTDTSIWAKLQHLGATVFPIESLLGININVFSPLSSYCRYSNSVCIKNFIETYSAQWEYILDNKSQRNYLLRRELPISINLHLTDHCNLNCKGCSHFAPIAKKYFLSENELILTLKRINRFGDNVVKEFCLMGGEPLLHPNLLKLLQLCREYLPVLPIKIISNGLLIMELDDIIWETCSKLGISVEITCYPIAYNYENLISYLQNKGVNAKLYVDRRDGVFRADVLNPKGENNIELNYARCRIGGIFPQVKNGKLFRCATAANIFIINNAFDKDFKYTSNDFLNLSDVINDDEIIEFLSSPSSFCKYCDLEFQHFEKWSISKHSPSEWGLI